MQRLLKKEYRKAVDIDFESASRAFSQLPATVFANANFYPCRKFKVAPKWGPATKLIPCIKTILDASGGNSVHHKSMEAHIRRWSSDGGMDLSQDTGDVIVLTLRSVISQMLNHKNHNRSIPNGHHTKYAVVWDKLATKDAAGLRRQDTNDDDDEDDDEADECVEVSITTKPKVETCSISSSQETSEEIDKDKVFSSSNAVLQKVLNSDEPEPMPAAPRHRLRNKCSSLSSQLGTSASSIKRLMEPISDGSVSPKAFKELQERLKQARKKNGKNAKGAKQKQKKKKQKNVKRPASSTKEVATNPEEKPRDVPSDALCKRFLKNAHSKIWHWTRNAELAKGSVDADAKAKARAAAAARMAKLAKRFKDGQIDHLGTALKEFSASDVE